jgi:anti-anti-sigma factor
VNRDDEGTGTPFGVSVEEAADGVAVVRASGEVDQLTAPGLAEAIGRVLDAPGSAVLVDLTAVGFLGSAGLAVLVEAATRAEKDARQLRVVADAPPVLRPLALTGLETVLSIHPTRQAAMQSLAVGTE